MGKPAARITDNHVCPMQTPGTPPIPHVGGPVIGPGVPTVLIGNMPAAVMGDSCVCVGPPDTIVSGSMGVLIGGKPAARMGDSTAHGGKIVVGCPTVLIGDGGGGGGGSAGKAQKSSADASGASFTKEEGEAGSPLEGSKGDIGEVALDYTINEPQPQPPCEILSDFNTNPQTDAEKAAQVEQMNELEKSVFKSIESDSPEVATEKTDKMNALLGTVKATDKAKLADAAYGGEDPPGYDSLSPEELDELGIHPDLLADEDSGFKSKIYKSKSGGPPPYTLAIAGTEDLTDWKANLGQGTGLESAQHRQAMVLGKMMRTSIPGGADGFDVTGHSLGGGLSSTVAMKTGAKATTFNAAGVHKSTMSRTGNSMKTIQAREQNVTAYNASKDPLTFAQDNRKTVMRGIGVMANALLSKVGLGMLGSIGAEAAIHSGALPGAFGNQIELKSSSSSLNPIKQHSMGVMIETMDAKNQENLLSLQEALGC